MIEGPRRVVITGAGIVGPLGNDVETAWRRLVAGESGIGRITRFDPSHVTSQIAGEVKDFDPADFMDRRAARRMDAYSQYAVAAARPAVSDAGLGVAAEAEDIGHTIHAHPTLSESVAMASEIYDGTITDLYIPKKK